MDTVTFTFHAIIVAVVIAGVRASNKGTPNTKFRSDTDPGALDSQADNPIETLSPPELGGPSVQSNDVKMLRSEATLQVYLKADGTPVNSETERAFWLEIRRKNVSATDAKKLVKLNGQVSAQRSALLAMKVNGDDGHNFESFALGIEREPYLANWVINNFVEHNFKHSKYLYVGKNPRHIATPDMVGSGEICEIKVSTKPLSKIKTSYRDQLQWQMHVTGLDRALFIVENRFTQVIEHEWIAREQHRINQLIGAADDFIKELDLLLEDGGVPECESQESVRSGITEEFARRDSAVRPLQGNRAAAKSTSSQDDKDFIQKTEELAFDDEKVLIEKYLHGVGVYELASDLRCTPAVVAGTLGRILFELSGDLVDESAENFGKPWSNNDVQQLQNLYRASRSIPDIASHLRRDQLGVCFKAILLLNPPVPQSQLAKHGLKKID